MTSSDSEERLWAYSRKIIGLVAEQDEAFLDESMSFVHHLIEKGQIADKIHDEIFIVFDASTAAKRGELE